MGLMFYVVERLGDDYAVVGYRARALLLRRECKGKEEFRNGLGIFGSLE